MDKETTPTDPEGVEQTAEELTDAERLRILHEWLDWIEEQNDGKPVALLVKEVLLGKKSRRKSIF